MALRRSITAFPNKNVLLRDGTRVVLASSSRAVASATRQTTSAPEATEATAAPL
jgi:hypothetical protein